MLYKRDAPGVYDNQVCTVLNRADDFVADHRVGFSSIRTCDEQAVSISNLRDGVCHCAASEGLHEACNSGRVSKTGTMVKVIRTNTETHEFLKDIVILVRAAG